MLHVKLGNSLSNRKFHTEFRAIPLRLSSVQLGATPILSDGDLTMGINTESDIEANLQIGPTDQGMVRLFIEANGIEIPMDFLPEEAEEIAEEILAAAKGAASMGGKKRR